MTPEQLRSATNAIIDDLRERLATAEADADQLAAELDQHGYGDFHYTSDDYRDKDVLTALRLHDEAVARRSQP